MHNLKTGDMCTFNRGSGPELEIIMSEGDKCVATLDGELMIIPLAALKPLPPKTLNISGDFPMPLEVSIVTLLCGEECDSVIRFKTEQDARDFSLHIKSLMQDQE